MKAQEKGGVEVFDYGDDDGKAQKVFQWCQNSNKVSTVCLTNALPMRESVFPQQTLVCGQPWGIWVFGLAESRMTSEIPSQLWLLLQTMEVEWAQLVSSKENQGFRKSSSFLRPSVQLGVQPNKEFSRMLCQPAATCLLR